MKLSIKSIFTTNNFLVLLYILLVIFLTWLRPIHQDDGWYASYAMNLYNKISGSAVFSTWDYSLAGYEAAGACFVYGLYQILFIAIFGSGVFYTKVLVVVTSLLMLFFLVKFVQQFIPRTAIFFPLLLFAWPGFWHHFYNRPEMLATAMGLAGMYLLIAPIKKHKRLWLCIAYILPFLMFDIHSISVFVVFGFYMWHFFFRRELMIYKIFGAVVGLGIYLAGNWLVHGSIGVFNGLIGLKINSGDHYVPILQSGLKDILHIAIERYKMLLLVFAASLLWLPLIIYRKSLKEFFDKKWIPVLFMLIGFIVTSSLFTEAISNGFLLYSSILFFLCIFMLLNFAWEQSFGFGKKKILVLLPVFLILAAANIKGMPRFVKQFEYAETFYDDYPKIANCLSKNSRGMLRPTFTFALAKQGGYYEYTLHFLFYMKTHSIGFGKALFQKNFDFIAIDPADRKGLFSKGNQKRIISWGGHNWFYNAIADISIDSDEFDQLIASGALKPICSFDEISHGFTQFYLIDKLILKQLYHSEKD